MTLGAHTFTSEISQLAQMKSLDRCLENVIKAHPLMPYYKQLELAQYNHRFEMAKYSIIRSGQRRERLSDL
ncbi:MAG TPA: hypothetical protein VLG50_03840 [Candidatus Saccharimonadales bacterium]|nr:hypothetical protein [Candidatus Saccharimonadales bacterium]